MIHINENNRNSPDDNSPKQATSNGGNPTSATDLNRNPHYLPARMVNEFNYCPRLFYFEHVEGLFVDNADTIEGNIRHKRVDKKTTALPKTKPKSKSKSKSKTKSLFGDDDDGSKTAAGDSSDSGSASDLFEKIHATSVTLSSEHYGIISKIDLVEVAGEAASPVEYKRGKPKTKFDGSLTAWDPERVQLCVQALVLREHGYRVDHGTIFFWETRQRVIIPIDQELVALTEKTLLGARQLLANPEMPPPLDASPKCPRCSLVSICLPDETNLCRQLAPDGSALTQPLLFDIGPTWDIGNNAASGQSEPPPTVRQLITARDHRKPLYLNTPGMTVGKSGEVLQVKEKRKVVQSVRLRETSQVNLMGAIQVSTQAIQTLMQLEIPLLYFSGGGWFYGMTQPVGLKNIMWRIEQFRSADSPEFCLRLAKQLVDAKVRNQRTLLMRNHIQPPSDAIRFLKALQIEIKMADSLATLLGVEGVAARTYFQNFAGMIKVTGEDPALAFSGLSAEELEAKSAAWLTFDFEGRNRRPPRDPVNALLSLGYSLLAKDLTVACAGVGLDPYLGFYHQPRYGRAALALDLMEPFRPLVVDSAVLMAINNRMIHPGDFLQAGNSVALTAGGRKGFIRAYEQRMDQLVTHPLFGYRVSYRRVIEIQVRLLARVLMGELKSYPGFTTR